MKKLSALFCLLSLILSTRTFAQSEKLTLEDIYARNTYQSKGVGQIRWMKDNKRYSKLESNQAIGGEDIVVYDAKSGLRTVLVRAEQLIPSGAGNPLDVANYSLQHLFAHNHHCGLSSRPLPW
jgi:dipeptidyl-peptidase-4